MYICARVCGCHGSRRRYQILGSWGSGALWAVDVGARIWSQVCWKSSKLSYGWASSLAQIETFKTYSVIYHIFLDINPWEKNDGLNHVLSCCALNSHQHCSRVTASCTYSLLFKGVFETARRKIIHLKVFPFLKVWNVTAVNRWLP